MVKEKFDDWFVSDDEIVGIVGMKWQDERKENFVTHSFLTRSLLIKGITFESLL